MNRLEIQVVHSPCQMLGESRFILDECLVDEPFCRSVSQLSRLPSLNLLPQGAKVSLHAVHSNSEAVLEQEILGVLCQYRREHAGDNVSKF